MKRKHLIFLMIILLVSCSSLGKRTVAESEIVSKDIVVERGIEEVSSKFGEEVSRKNIGVYKRGYRNWKLVMYGTNNYYIVNVAEKRLTWINSEVKSLFSIFKNNSYINHYNLKILSKKLRKSFMELLFLSVFILSIVPSKRETRTLAYSSGSISEYSSE